MNLEEALMHFELDKGAGLFQLEEKYTGLKEQYELLMANAPNPTVLKVYKKNLDDLTEAYNFAIGELKSPLTEEVAFSVMAIQAGAPQAEIEAQYKNIKFELEAGMKLPDKAVQAECKYELQRLEEAYSFIQHLLEERRKKAQFNSLIHEGDTCMSKNDFEQAAKKYQDAGILINDPLVQQKLAALEALKKKITDDKKNAFIKQAEEFISKEKFSEAIVLLNEALELDKGSSELIQKIAAAEGLEKEKARKLKEEQERKEREERERKLREEQERKELEERKRKEQEEKERQEKALKEQQEKERREREQEEARKRQAEKEQKEREEKAFREKQDEERQKAAAEKTQEPITSKPTQIAEPQKQFVHQEQATATTKAHEGSEKNRKPLIMSIVVLIVAVASGYIFYSTHLATVAFLADKNATITLGGGTMLELTANSKLEAKIAPGDYEFSAKENESGETVTGTFKVESRFGEVMVNIPFNNSIVESDNPDTLNTKVNELPNQVAVEANSNEAKPITNTPKNNIIVTEQPNSVKQESQSNIVTNAPASTTVAQVEKSSAIETELNEAEFNLWWMGLDITWKKILLQAGRISDINSMENKNKVMAIRRLDISNQKITSLEPLTELKQLSELTALDNNIQSLEPLRGLKKLEYLWLAKNKVSSIEPISGLTRLKTLNLQKNNLSTIDPIKNLTNLETLFINYNNISNLKPLYGLTKLKSIASKFNACSEADIEALKAQLPGATFSNY